MTRPAPANAFVPTADNTRQLRDAFGKFATGVTIVTAHSELGPVAITANSFSSVSLDPPMVLWCPDKASKRYPAFAAAEHYAIHVLSADQTELCWKIAGDGFALRGMELSSNVDGVPILEGCLARFECRQSTLYDGGDHAIILGQVLRAHLADGGAPLAFFDGNVRQVSPQ
jgi:flavin reductase (DIM6/NTAB) family NADH-FMN oxidoreductase RutF